MDVNKFFDVMEQVFAEMRGAQTTEVKIIGQATEQTAGEIEVINAESNALKERIKAKITDYTRERMENVKREIATYIDAEEAANAPAIQELQDRQNAAWAKMRVEMNIPAEVADADISINRETGEVSIIVLKDPANG